MSVGGEHENKILLTRQTVKSGQVGWLMRAQKYLDGSGRFLGAGFSNDCNGFLH
jgi:hypothetical protein